MTSDTNNPTKDRDFIFGEHRLRVRPNAPRRRLELVDSETRPLHAGGQTTLRVLEVLLMRAAGREENDPHRVVTREQILTDVLRMEAKENAVDQHIGLLNLVLPSGVIITTRGLGFRIGVPVRESGAVDITFPGNRKTRPVHCEWLGNDVSGLDAVIPKLKSPNLVTVKDTYVRLEKEHTKYDDTSFRKWTSALRMFAVAHAKNSTAICVYEVFGGHIQNSYIRDLIRAARGRKVQDKFSFHQFEEGRGPIMNFILLEYEDNSERDEVFFGWGRYNRRAEEAVFRSIDPKLVQEFKSFYEVLLDRNVSTKKDLPDLESLNQSLSLSARRNPSSDARLRNRKNRQT